MRITLTTPAIVFSTISLLLLAYTNRFLAIASLIRNLHDKKKEEKQTTYIIESQISSLKKRIKLIRDMQFLAILSLFFCVFSMFLIFFDKIIYGEIVFVISLIFLMLSLIYSAIEINLSVIALNIQLSECVGEECNIKK
ncbi:MAG: hypothetical protein PWP46_739 [Fusobacteriaceae bacterium]|jgi:hypothetical protein|nr:hypothetical protein [Fusobacteriales bacterium]MDN5303860.1 hypothetical protein [Fusobacteriaceae bacterium]